MNCKLLEIQDRIPHENEVKRAAYNDIFEHLKDKLLILDNLIRILIIKYINNNHDITDNWRQSFALSNDIKTLLEESKKERISSGDDNLVDNLIKNNIKIRKDISKKTAGSQLQNVFLPLINLSKIFCLNVFEQEIFVVCIAVEYDVKYERLFSYLHDDITKIYPSIGLILSLYSPVKDDSFSLRECLHSISKLTKYKLIRHIEDKCEKPLMSGSIKIEERITEYIFGSNSIDPQILSIAELKYPAKDWSTIIIEDSLKKRLQSIIKRLNKRTDKYIQILNLHGSFGIGKKHIIDIICNELKLAYLLVQATELPDDTIGFENSLRLIFREAFLQQAVVCFEYSETFSGIKSPYSFKGKLFKNIIEDYPCIIIFTGLTPIDRHLIPGTLKCFTVNIPENSYSIRKRLWNKSLENHQGVPREKLIEDLAGKYRFTAGQIKDAAAFAQNQAVLKSVNGELKLKPEDLYRSCSLLSNQNLSIAATEIKSNYTWTDIVLPDDKYRQLREICNYVKYSETVFNEWGFAKKLTYGKGLNALFSGPSGTGKTMAAEIIANDLNIDLYKIDLSRIVSKYVGETEKNLSKIFHEAETSNSILFFDEADALFGKRSEVKDAHDRYANIETNYLLQKIEEHTGVVILATNFRKNIDDAFTRRISYSVEFPFPDEEYRLRIWRIVFPESTPVNEKLDYVFLANRFKIAGGNINNIALNSAFLAADDLKKICMKHVIHAIKREYQKMGRLCTKSEFGKYYRYVSNEEYTI